MSHSLAARCKGCERHPEIEAVITQLASAKRRATYGAVRDYLALSHPRYASIGTNILLAGHSKDVAHSWVVNGRTGLPGGYDQHLLDAVSTASPPITTSSDLALLLGGVPANCSSLSQDCSTSAAQVLPLQLDVKVLSVPSLLALYGNVLGELRDRKVVKTNNPPAGDYAEYLVAAALKGTIAPNSQKSWDVALLDGSTIQVKGRLVINRNALGDRQLSTIRSFDFDKLAVVLFNGDYTVWKAALCSVEVALSESKEDKHVNGWRLFATDHFLSLGEDLTEHMRGLTGEAYLPVTNHV